MSCIVIVDMRSNSGQVLVITEEDGYACQVFETEEDAEESMEHHPLNVFPFQVVELD